MNRLMQLSLLLLSLASVTAAQAQQVKAFLDRTSIFAGETVVLTVETEVPVDGATPDVGRLTQDFEILSSNSSTQIQIVNNRQSVQTRWVFELEPKHIGALTLPALAIGPQLSTPELKLEVLPLLNNPRTNQDILVEVDAEPRNPYVQEQVRYSERILLGTRLRDDSLRREGVINDALLQPLGGFKEYVAQRNGRNYRVYERNFALIPEKSGELVLPALTLRGRSSGRNSGQALSRGRRIQASSEALTLQVRPRPADYRGDYWLPSQQLTLTANWSQEPPTLRIGEPSTLTLTLQAQGLDAGQLPELTLPDLDWANLYPDQPLSETSHDDNWLMGQREQRLALVPTRTGSVELPEIRVVWWDTQKDQESVAVIPARTLDILPALNANDQSQPAATPPLPEEAPVTAPPDLLSPLVTAETDHWLWLSVVLLFLWLATLLAWWRDRQRPKEPVETSTEPVNQQQARRLLQQACQRNDPRAAADALLSWASVLWPNHPPTSLGALADRLNRDNDPIRQLDRTLYASADNTADSSWEGASLWQSVRHGLAPNRPKRQPLTDDKLAPLYPRKALG